MYGATDTKWQCRIAATKIPCLNYNIARMATYTSLKVHIIIPKIFYRKISLYQFKKKNKYIYL